MEAMNDDGASWDEIGDEFGRTGDAVRRHAQVIFDGTVKEMELGVDYDNIQMTMYEGEK